MWFGTFTHACTGLWGGRKWLAVFSRGGPYPLIIWPNIVLETFGFLWVVGDIARYPRHRTILMAHQPHGQGWGKIKSWGFLGWKFTGSPLSDRSLTHYPNGHLSGVASHLSYTPAKAANRYQQYPGSWHWVYAWRVFDSFHYCSDSCGQMLSNFGGSPCKNKMWDLSTTFKDCCPTLPLSDPGNPESVVPPWFSPWPLIASQEVYRVAYSFILKDLSSLLSEMIWYILLIDVIWHIYSFSNISTGEGDIHPCLCSTPSTPQGHACDLILTNLKNLC